MRADDQENGDCAQAVQCGLLRRWTTGKIVPPEPDKLNHRA
jgi:hypothetical protein